MSTNITWTSTPETPVAVVWYMSSGKSTQVYGAVEDAEPGDGAHPLGIVTSHAFVFVTSEFKLTDWIDAPGSKLAAALSSPTLTPDLFARTSATRFVLTEPDCVVCPVAWFVRELERVPKIGTVPSIPLYACRICR
jgi:hypothetical protein